MFRYMQFLPGFALNWLFEWAQYNWILKTIDNHLLDKNFYNILQTACFDSASTRISPVWMKVFFYILKYQGISNLNLDKAGIHAELFRVKWIKAKHMSLKKINKQNPESMRTEKSFLFLYINRKWAFSFLFNLGEICIYA